MPPVPLGLGKSCMEMMSHKINLQRMLPKKPCELKRLLCNMQMEVTFGVFKAFACVRLDCW